MDCLTTVRRRRTIRILSDRAGSVTEQQLAARLAAAARGTSTADVSHDAVQDTRLGLRHVDLPKLEAAGLVAWEEDDAIVTATDHPILADPTFQRLLEEGQDTVVEVLASERCRETLTSLATADGHVTETELARDLAGRLADDAPDDRVVERARLKLYHAVLPKLEAASLIERDEDAETIAYDGPGDLPDLLGVDGPAGPAGDESGTEIKIP